MRVLFVDDEVAVLEGLENLLRKERHRWDMVFTTNADAALAEMARSDVDVVVSDMRMPGMHGSVLLTTVRDQYPGTARIVLSGHSEREAIVKSLPVAHQFLSKPCDVGALRTAIERTRELQMVLADEGVRRIVGKLHALPSVPQMHIDLTMTAAKPSSSIADIAKIVERDPAMSVKALQLVNSSFFGVACRVTSIQHAVSLLGIELFKGLALTAQIFASSDLRPVKGFSLLRIQQCSLGTARLAKLFLRDREHQEEAFTAGLVHDIGKVIIALGMPDQYADVVQRAKAEDTPLHIIEKETFGVSHAEVGAYLLGVWGLPFSIVESVAHHHNPSAVSTGEREVLAAVHVADALLDTASAAPGSPRETRLDMHFLDSAGFAARLPHWRELAVEEAKRLESMS